MIRPGFPQPPPPAPRVCHHSFICVVLSAARGVRVRLRLSAGAGAPSAAACCPAAPCAPGHCAPPYGPTFRDRCRSGWCCAPPYAPSSPTRPSSRARYASTPPRRGRRRLRPARPAAVPPPGRPAAQPIACDRLVRVFATDGVEVPALQGLDLLVAEGELMALVGASGSGKSTLSGLVRSGGQVHRWPGRRRPGAAGNPCVTVQPVAAGPAGGSGVADLEAFGGPAQRPAVLDNAPSEPQPACGCQWGVTVDHEGLLHSAVDVAIPTEPEGPHLVQAPSTRVTNVPGQHT